MGFIALPCNHFSVTLLVCLSQGMTREGIFGSWARKETKNSGIPFSMTSLCPPGDHTGSWELGWNKAVGSLSA